MEEEARKIGKKGMIGFALLFMIIAYLVAKDSIREREINNEIDANLVTVIGRVKESGRYGFTYSYYYGDTKYYGYQDGGAQSWSVGRYFVLELSGKNPKLSRLDLNREIEEDSARLVTPGFRKKTLTEILDAK